MKNIINKFYKKYSVPERWIDFRGQQASDIIEIGLKSNKPFMVARLGGVELDAMIRIKKYSNKYLNIFGQNKRNNAFLALQNNAGFFPIDDEMLQKFYTMMYSDLHKVDIFGSWRRREAYFNEALYNSIKIPLEDIEPYYHVRPWSSVLTGKKVLIIHPFSESIKKQYLKKEYLFKNKDILPEFELITLKAVQTITGLNSGFNNWFEALDSMKAEICNINFDIAILGCGAYGFPLAAFIKDIGKKAIHMGGATQILFGIKGKRWENNPRIACLMNNYWIRPEQSETPEHALTIENGCYW